MLAQMCTPAVPAGGRACGDTGHTGGTPGGRTALSPAGGASPSAPTGRAVPSGRWGLKHRTRGRRPAQWAGHSEGHVDPGGGLGNRCLAGRGWGGVCLPVRGDLKPEATGGLFGSVLKAGHIGNETNSRPTLRAERTRRRRLPVCQQRRCPCPSSSPSFPVLRLLVFSLQRARRHLLSAPRCSHENSHQVNPSPLRRTHSGQ